MTPHNTAKPGDFAKTVLMPGDPLRAKWIAETYLENPVLVNPVRGGNGYTWTYRGQPVSVMASGMGGPSIAIYAHELFTVYGVENILRVGSAGALRTDVPLGTLVAAMGSCYEASLSQQYQLPGTFSAVCSYPLLRRVCDTAQQLGTPLTVGSVLSSDLFYSPVDLPAVWGPFGVLAAEMESASLYLTAARDGGNALCLCTISDIIPTGAALSAEERQTGLGRMITLALESAPF